MNKTTKTTLSLLISCLSTPLLAENKEENTPPQLFSAVLPTIEVISIAENAVNKGYINYDEASVTRSQLATQEIAQTIDILNIQKNKNYGTNDLSSILEGNAGIDAAYDMRGESIYLRGFQADANDIYRDGVRESGQVRRSTANIERVEILKGPASILYGRGGGGGVINMVSKSANFTPNYQAGIHYGSWDNRGANIDINHPINDNWAFRLTADYQKSHAWRYGVSSIGRMFSPSLLYKNNSGELSWLLQYTYDDAWRVPDRNPNRTTYDQMGIEYRKGFARPGDYVEDKLRVIRSQLNYQINPNWQIEWQIAHRSASQNFDHYYMGDFDETTRELTQVYYRQKTKNTTFSNTFTLIGDFNTGAIRHHLTTGIDYSQEHRHPQLQGGNVYTDRTTGAFVNPYDNIINPYAPRDSWTRYTGPFQAATDNYHKGKSIDFFAQDLIYLNEKLKLSLGGRISHYSFSTERRVYQSKPSNDKKKYTDTTFSPNIGILYDITTDDTLYLSYAKNFAPYGGRSYIGIDPVNNPDLLDKEPQKSVQWEIGIKNNWFNKRLNTNLAIYQIQRYNVRYRPDSRSPTLWSIREERSRGIELSAIGQIWDKWYVRSSIGVMQAKITKDLLFPELNNRHLGYTSNFTGNLFVRYAPNNRFYGELGVTHLGDRYGSSSVRIRNGVTNFTFNPNLEGYTRFDALMGYNYKSFNATFAISNLFNKQYWRSDSMPGNPRAYLLRLNYHFN